MAICLSIYLSIDLSIYRSICLHIDLTGSVQPRRLLHTYNPPPHHHHHHHHHHHQCQLTWNGVISSTFMSYSHKGS